MTDTHDTAAALWSAIDAYGCDAAWHGALGRDATTRAAIDRAITAHVEAEVARRLAAAPGVEQQIDLLRRAAYGATITGVSVGGMRETIDRLRAAIAADKARAVEAARPTPDEARRLVALVAEYTEGIIDYALNGTTVVAAGYGTAATGTIGPDPRVASIATARTALLRALGVEA